MAGVFGIPLRLKQLASPTSPVSGYNKVYAKSDDKLYIMSSGGTETLVGPAAAATVNASQIATCSVAANPTSTTNVTITGLSIVVLSPGTSAVFAVELDLDWSIVTAGTIALTELLVDGTAQTAQMVLYDSGTSRVPSHKKWRITGLSAGNHTFTARTRNSAAATSSQVNTGNSTMYVMQEV